MKIDINNFESIIDPDILSRGLQICQNDAIQTLEKIGGNDYSATVIGTDSYLINIAFDRAGALLTHSCSCPYQAGPICKHKTAVFFTIRNHLQNDTPFVKGQLNLLKANIEQREQEELAQIIMELAKHNLSSRNNLLQILGLNNHSPS